MSKTMHRHEASSAERMLDELDPATDQMSDGRYLRAIGTALDQLERGEENLRQAVQNAHAAGTPWSAIGLVLGTSRQAAHRKYASPTER